MEWQLQATVAPDPEKQRAQQQRKACFVRGTNIEAEAVPDEEILPGYKGQGSAERGFGFLKTPPRFRSHALIERFQCR